MLELSSKLNIYSEPLFHRKTGIICTIGPASNTKEMLVDLIISGMCIVRLNFSHGSHEYHANTIKTAREAAAVRGKPIAIALDTKGPEIRTGVLVGFDKDERVEVELVSGNSIVVTTNDEFKEKCDAKTLWIDYKNLPKVIRPGGLIFIDDGLISLRVESIDGENLHCIVVNSGFLGSRKGVNLPNVNVDLPAISKKDEGDLKFGIEQNIDMVFASFIRKRQDVLDIRAALGEEGANVLIISKIENHQGIQNFDEILEVSDGIMVARGDLGIEIPLEKVFLAQKMMIAKCNLAGKPVICATQMLESMTKNPRPTRAETSDVANAVLDGADCVMLSGETAKGKYPVESVGIMASICAEAEGAIFYRNLRESLRQLVPVPHTNTETTAIAAVDASISQNAKAIICLTTSGNTARLLSKWRPRCPIVAVTRNEQTSRQLQLHRGVHPLFYNQDRSDGGWLQDVEDRIRWAMRFSSDHLKLTHGDAIIVVHGWQSGPGSTNTMRVFEFDSKAVLSGPHH
eukprot:m.286160 g.286160  ORF g.286160 m.286160 type:complete len:515 (+) comp11527_c0_seq1:4239-5783(+)